MVSRKRFLYPVSLVQAVLTFGLVASAVVSSLVQQTALPGDYIGV
jgi:hypothetical protein